jgi:hypothetical protein
MPDRHHIVGDARGGLRVIREGATSDSGNIFADAAWAVSAPLRQIRISKAWSRLRGLVNAIRRAGMPADEQVLAQAVATRSLIRRLQSRHGFTPAEASEYREALLRVARGESQMAGRR